MGLMRYVARTPIASELTISHNEDLETELVTDKWNNWVFQISSSPRFVSEEKAKRFSINNSIEISRITPDFKIEIEMDQSFNRRKYIDDEEGEAVYIKTDESLDMLFVKSLGEHWSAGINWDLNASTEENLDFNTEIMPAIEYDLFPYSEATRRQLRFLYSAGYEYNDYIDTTSYFKTTENFLKHRLRIAYQVQQKWGSINISMSETNFFNDMSRNILSLSGNVRLRILKGLSLSVNGSVSYNNYQPSLPKGELTEAEILLQLKQQRSAYFVQGGISLTYTFGSIYNNVVNPRFGNGGGGGGGVGMYFN
jgi:enamine deaminase RidA (YjgF/YER057c/UK114 family)